MARRMAVVRFPRVTTAKGGPAVGSLWARAMNDAALACKTRFKILFCLFLSDERTAPACHLNGCSVLFSNVGVFLVARLEHCWNIV